MSITLTEAKNMMTEDSLIKLKSFVTTRTPLNMDNKVNNDILMQALCRSVKNGIIKETSLNDKIINLLNSATNTLSQTKLIYILKQVERCQPNIKCVISLMSQDMKNVDHVWEFTSTNVDFNSIFRYIVKRFNMTPSEVRNKMKESLKPTIVNNIAQLLSRYEKCNELTGINVSINTIARLVNMEDQLLFADFVDEKK